MIEIEGRQYYSLREVQDTTGFKVGWLREQSEQLLMIMEGLGQMADAAIPGDYPGAAYFQLSMEKVLHILIVNTHPAARRTYQYVKARVGSQLLMDCVRNLDSRAQVYGLLKRSVSGLMTTRKPAEIPSGLEFSVAPVAHRASANLPLR